MHNSKLRATLISELHKIVEDTHGESFLRILNMPAHPFPRSVPNAHIYFHHILMLRVCTMGKTTQVQSRQTATT